MRCVLILLVLLSVFNVFAEESKEKDRLAVMDVQDKENIFNSETRAKVTDYIFTKMQTTNIYWMIPKADRDSALEQAIDETKQSSRKECVDEKCQLSLVAELQANFLINTEIIQLVKGKCQISIKKFDVEKRAGTEAWQSKFNCTGEGAYEAIDSLNLGGKKNGSSFQEGKIGESAGEWEVGQGEETIVNFESEPAGAVVMVDGKMKCQKTPCSKMISEGNHEISMQLENYVEQAKGAVVKKGTKIRYTLEPDFGYLTVSGKYKVELKLDGEIIGNIPVSKRVINPGAHQIEHTNPCYYESGEKFQIKRGDNKEINMELNPKESAIKVTAQDKDGNDVEAEVFVDGKNVGTAPGTFKVPWCSREVAVKTKKSEFKQSLDLQEKKISTIDAVLKPSGGNWSKKSPNKMTWSGARKYCEDLIEKGYSDWRLPTISELRTLIQNCPATETSGACNITNECLSLKECRSNACNGCSGSEDGGYSELRDTERLWSSSFIVDGSDNVLYVGFYNGGVYSGNVANATYARCVLGEFEQTIKLQEKKVSTIDAVLKPLSEDWSKKAPNEMSWSDAKRYCANLNEGGYSDWRLPTISELRSLVKNCPATETGGECGVTDSCLSYAGCWEESSCYGCGWIDDGRYCKLGDTGWLWSSSEISNDPNYAWWLYFGSGSVGNSSYGKNVHGIRCVR